MTNGTTFNLTDVSVVAGTNVDFVLYGGPGGASFISAQIDQASTAILPPPAPTGLAASALNKQVDLGWAATVGATNYNIKRSLVGGGPYTTIATGITDTSYQDSGLTNGVTYYYVVSATNSVGEGGDSAEASATPQPVAAPSGLTAKGTNGQVNLTWTGPLGATSYNIKRSLTDGGPYATIATGITGTTYADTGLTNGTTYYYQVSASNSDGEGPDSNQPARCRNPCSPTFAPITRRRRQVRRRPVSVESWVCPTPPEPAIGITIGGTSPRKETQFMLGFNPGHFGGSYQGSYTGWATVTNHDIWDNGKPSRHPACLAPRAETMAIAARSAAPP